MSPLARRVLLLALGAAATAGCPGPRGEPGSDAALLDGAPLDGGAPRPGPAPPRVPWIDPTTGAGALEPDAPAFAPCPAGFREVDGACDPWPEGGQRACPAGEAHLPGEPGCARLGVACPAVGEYADGLPGDAPVLYVRPLATGGDGSLAAPFGTLGEARAALTPGATIALSRGHHDAGLLFAQPVELRGACVTATSLGPMPTTATLWLEAPGSVVRDLTVTGLLGPGIFAVGDADVTIEGVVITGVDGVGLIAAEGARATLREAHVHDIPPRASDGRYGRAGIAQDGAELVLERVLVERTHEAALVAVGSGSRLRIRSTAVLDTREALAPRQGWGLWAAGGGLVHASDSTIEEAGEAAVAAEGPSSSVVLDQVVAARPRPGATGGAFALLAAGGAQAEASRLRVRGATGTAVTAQGAGTRVVVSDLIVDEGVADAALGLARAAEVTAGARVEGRRARVLEPLGGAFLAIEGELALEDVLVRGGRDDTPDLTGALVADEGSSLTAARVRIEDQETAGLIVQASDAVLADVWVQGVRARELDANANGMALLVLYGGHVTLDRFLFEDTQVVAVSAYGGDADTSLALTDGVLRRVRAQPASGRFGYGLTGDTRTTLELSRLVIGESRGVGLFATGAAVVAEDLLVRDTLAEDATQTFGRGIVVTAAGSLAGSRVRVERAQDVAVLAGRLAQLRLTDVEVVDTLEQACATTTCPTRPFGTAVLAVEGASVVLEGFLIDRAALCGVHVWPGGVVDLHDGQVSGCAIGACVQDPAFDLARLQRRVVFRDNGVNLQATSLPVPDATVPIAPAR